VTSRDRMVVIVCVVAAILAGTWIKVVSPERQKASKLTAQVSSAQAQLSTAEGKLASARAAESQYSSAYAAMVNLGKAVPPTQEVPSLMYEVEQATTAKRVDFTAITAGAGSAGSTTVTAPPASSSASSASKSSSSSSSSSSAGQLTQVPFTFVFEGTYFDLEHLLSEFTGYTTRTSTGTLQVSGRLLTVQSVKLSPANSSGTKAASTWLAGTITATAYTAPAPSAALLGASPAAPAAGGASAASSSGSSSSATTPAVVKVTP